MNLGSDISKLVLEGVKRSNDVEITRIILELALIARIASAQHSSLRAYVEQLATDLRVGLDATPESVELSQQITQFLATQ